MTLRIKKRGAERRRWERALLLRSDAAAQGSSEKVGHRGRTIPKIYPRGQRKRLAVTVVPDGRHRRARYPISSTYITVTNPGGGCGILSRLLSWVGDLIIHNTRLSLFRDTNGPTRKGIRSIQCETSNRKLPKIAMMCIV